jgi:hypothetical protein
MKPVSLADISYEQGLQLLALRKQAMDAGHIRRMPAEALANTMPLAGIGDSFTKRANYFSDLAGSVTNRLTNMSPEAHNVLLSGAAGAGLGALTGLGTAYTSGKGNYLGRALRGGLAGGAMGGGLGLALNPEIAEKLYAKGKSFIDGAGAAKEKSPDTGAQAPPPGGKITPEVKAKAILAASPEAQRNALSELDAVASSYKPELVAGGLTAAGGGAGLLAAKKLHDVRSFDSRGLANEIFTQGSANSSKLEPTALGKLLGAPDNTAKQVGQKALNDMSKGWLTPTTSSVSSATLADQLKDTSKQTGLDRLLNRTPKAVESQLSNLAKHDAGALARLQAASRTPGFRDAAGKIKPIKAKGLAGLALALLTGAGYTGYNYLTGRQERAHAQDTLKNLAENMKTDESSPQP